MTEADKNIKREIRVETGLGLHARMAARIAEIVGNFNCRVVFSKDGMVAEADSVLAILTLDAPKGTKLWVEAKGSQAEQALDALETLLAQERGEDK